MFAILHTLGAGTVLGLHLLCLNVAACAPLLCIGLDFAGRRGNAAAEAAAKYLAQAAALFLLGGTLLGLALGALLYSGEPALLFDALSRLNARIQWAWWELIFSVALIFAYAAWWKWTTGPASLLARVVRSLVAVAGTTNLLYHFPPLFGLFTRVTASGNAQGTVFSSSEIRAQFFEGEIASRWVHFVVASAAASGLFLAACAVRLARRGNLPQAQSLAVTGGRIAFFATLLQLPVGLWVTLSLPGAAQSRLMGSDLGTSADGTLAPLLLGASLLLVLALLYQLALVSLGSISRYRMVGIMLLFTLVVVLMSAMLLAVRATLGGLAA